MFPQPRARDGYHRGGRRVRRQPGLLPGRRVRLNEAARRAGAVATQSVLKPGTQTSFPDREELADNLGTGP